MSPCVYRYVLKGVCLKVCVKRCVFKGLCEKVCVLRCVEPCVDGCVAPKPQSLTGRECGAPAWYCLGWHSFGTLYPEPMGSLAPTRSNVLVPGGVVTWPVGRSLAWCTWSLGLNPKPKTQNPEPLNPLNPKPLTDLGTRSEP